MKEGEPAGEPIWVKPILKTKLLKDTKIMCQDTICGCPSCKHEAKSISDFWEVPIPSVTEAKHFKNVIDNSLYGDSKTITRAITTKTSPLIKEAS